MRMAGWEPDLSREERPLIYARRKVGGMANVMEGTEGGGQRPSLGYNRTCWNCRQKGHLARDCSREDKRGSNLRVRQTREKDKWRG